MKDARTLVHSALLLVPEEPYDPETWCIAAQEAAVRRVLQQLQTKVARVVACLE